MSLFEFIALMFLISLWATLIMQQQESNSKIILDCIEIVDKEVRRQWKYINPEESANAWEYHRVTPQANATHAQSVDVKGEVG